MSYAGPISPDSARSNSLGGHSWAGMATTPRESTLSASRIRPDSSEMKLFSSLMSYGREVVRSAWSGEDHCSDSCISDLLKFVKVVSSGSSDARPSPAIARLDSWV